MSPDEYMQHEYVSSYLRIGVKVSMCGVYSLFIYSLGPSDCLRSRLGSRNGQKRTRITKRQRLGRDREALTQPVEGMFYSAD